MPRDGSLRGQIATDAAIAGRTAPPTAISRTKDNFVWSDGPGVLMIDLDDLAEWANGKTIPQLRQVLISIAPALETIPMTTYPSASACLKRTNDGSELRGLTGLRVYVPVARSADIPELGRRLFDRAVLAGHGRAFVSKSGSIHQRSILDAAVWSPERLDFIAGASCGAGVIQDRGTPVTWKAESLRALTLQDLPELSEVERAELSRRHRALFETALPVSQARRGEFVASRRAAGVTVAATWNPSGTVDWLEGDHEILLENGSLVTVDEILASPNQYHSARCADPLEHDYGGDHRLAKIYTLNQTSGPVVHSNAHGGVSFMLRRSAAADFGPAESAAEPARTLWSTQDNQRTSGYKLSDLGNSERFADAHRDRLIYVPNDDWYAWDGHRWRPADPVAIQERAKELVRKMDRGTGSLPDSPERTAARKWAFQSEHATRIRAIVELSRGALQVEAEALDTDSLLLNVPNGTIDLRTGRLCEHRPQDYITKLAPVAYDPAATCPRFLGFLDRVFAGNQELIRGIQALVGYSLTGDTREQVLIFLFGDGANGKSTFIECLRDMLGDYACQMDVSTLMPRSGAGPRSDIVRLRGTRLVPTSEAPRGKRFDETLLKSLTGGDTLAARGVYARSEIEFRPTFKLWGVGNHKPELPSDDPAVWRRIRLIPFTITIPPEERDPGLGEALRAELPGILAWAVRGCLEWQEHGLPEVAAITEATAAYRAEMSEVAAFLSERCHAKVGAKTACSVLYDEYVAWCNSDAKPYQTRKEFDEQVRKHDPGRIEQKKISSMHWVGLELLPETPDAAPSRDDRI